MRARSVIAVAAVVAVVALLAAGFLLRQSDAAVTPGPSAALTARGPVLLVPGYGGGTAVLEAAATRLRAQGSTVEIVGIGDGRGDLAAYAGVVAARAKELVALGAPSVDLVGFSAGGVIVRDAATRPDALADVRKVITIGAPHAGTQLSTLGGLVGSCPTACQQLAPGSDYLTVLATANSTQRWLSIWSTTDEVIRPPTSSQLEGATWFPLQDVCSRQVAHNELMGDPLTQATVADFLADVALPTSCNG